MNDESWRDILTNASPSLSTDDIWNELVAHFSRQLIQPYYYTIHNDQQLLPGDDDNDHTLVMSLPAGMIYERLLQAYDILKARTNTVTKAANMMTKM